MCHSLFYHFFEEIICFAIFCFGVLDLILAMAIQECVKIERLKAKSNMKSGSIFLKNKRSDRATKPQHLTDKFS